jgi:hypothetical protein
VDRERRGRSESGAKTRQGNQYRKEGDGVAMRGETTDPTYNFADMIIGVFSYLKLILIQNESETRKVSWGVRKERRGGRRFQSQGLYSLIQTPVIVICPCYSPQYSVPCLDWGIQTSSAKRQARVFMYMYIQGVV